MQTNTGKQYSTILTEAMRDEFRNLICESGLDENDVINFGGGRTYPKYGQAVVMCGGGGSGKGFVISNLLPIDGKQLDVDSFKERYKEMLWNPNSRVRREDPRIGDHPFEPGYEGMDPDQAYNMANPDDVYALHVNTSDWKGMQRKGISKGMINPKHLNNLIFDITGKSQRDIMSCVRMCKDVGYTMHLVWVVTSRSRALQQNFSRERKVPQDILHDAHNKIMDFLPTFITTEAGKYFAHCWVVFNSQPGLDGSKVKNPCVELPKQDGRFVISDEVKERLLTTLGPKEVNPTRPQTYLDAKEIAPQDKFYSTPKMNKSKTIHLDGTETITKTPAVDKRGKQIMNVSNTETDKYGRDYRGDASYVRK